MLLYIYQIIHVYNLKIIMCNLFFCPCIFVAQCAVWLVLALCKFTDIQIQTGKHTGTVPARSIHTHYSFCVWTHTRQRNSPPAPSLRILSRPPHSRPDQRSIHSMYLYERASAYTYFLLSQWFVVIFCVKVIAYFLHTHILPDFPRLASFYRN